MLILKGIQISLVFICLSFSLDTANSQNLVPNGDFDEYDQCPTAENHFNGYVRNWSLLFGETSYFNKCGHWIYFNFPSRNNSPGNARISTFRRNTTDQPRTYLRNQLVRPLDPGEVVYISFWIHDFGGRYYYSEDYSIYFSDTLVTQSLDDDKQWIELPAQFNWTGGIISDLGVFVPITGCYEAKGGEEFICLGNFKHPDSMRVDSAHYRARGNELSLDDVKIISENDIDFSDISFCPGRTYRWQDPYDMNFRVRLLGANGTVNSFTMPNEVVELEVFLPECGVADTIKITPEPCEDCFSVPSDLDICILDTILMETLLTDDTELVIGNRVYRKDDIFRPTKDTSYLGIFRSEYCDTIALVGIEVRACASCSPMFESLTLCPGEQFNVSSYKPFELTLEGVKVSKDTVISESGVYSIVLSSARCDTVDSFDLTVRDCHDCISGLELDRLQFCVNEPLSLEPFLQEDHFIEGEWGQVCPGNYKVFVRHETCSSWLDSIAVQVRGDQSCYSYQLRDTLCEGEQIIVEKAPRLRLELGMKSRFSGGYNQALALEDMFCPEITFYPKEVTVFECEDCQYALPNVFSPNSDGVNDIFSISLNCSVFDFQAEIYDRWGSMLYRSRDPYHIWDGGDARIGTYVYRIQMELYNGREVENKVETGTITLIR